MSRSVFLVGFMAAGKTTVGERVADQLGVPFIDLDLVIEEQAGTSVSGLFDSVGEAEFREREAKALRDVIAGPPAVVATGGGAPCFGDNMDAMRSAGLVVALSSGVDELLERVGDSSTRPLMAMSEQQLRELYASREPIYRRAHSVVRTEGVAANAVAESVTQLAGVASALEDRELSDMTLVSLADRAYPVVVREGSLARLGPLMRALLPLSSDKVAVISDSNVQPLYGESVSASLSSSGYSVSSHTVPAGEASKTIDRFSELAAQLVSAGLDRRSTVVALGGGVVGDLAGFVASALYRGVSVVQVPTTLVAMTDSAIGGKTGVNLPAGKNLVGAFWQPSLVVADTGTLVTLPERERRAAYGELIKYGLLDGDELLNAVDGVAGGVPDADLIGRCAGIKSWIVSRDEREQTGERALLNLGHTVGHAIEAAAGYGAVYHGEAVALGLIATCRVSRHLGLCDDALELRVIESIRDAGLDCDLEPWLRDDVISRIGVDKKRTRETIGFVGLASVGRPLRRHVALADLERILRPRI